MGKWLLIDGFNMAFRSFYAIPELKRSDGLHTNAIHGWVRTLWKLEDSEEPDHVAVFFDLGGASRQLALLPEYKANRKETPKEFEEQIPAIKELTAAFGYSIVEQEGIEADDLLASAAHKLVSQGHTVKIVSADKDFAQCIQKNLTQLLPPPTANPKLGWRELDVQGVIDKYGIKPSQISDYLALIGDSSDNIPGIAGVGPKTATKWIQQWGDIDSILSHANEIKPSRFVEKINKSESLLKRNQAMITLHTHLPCPTLNETHKDPDKFIYMLEDLEMQTAARDAIKRLGPKQAELF